MSFLNIALLGGAAAFLIPLAIHLLNRSRHQSIDWGAMHLLEAALQVNSRRFQWESILLLLLRCLIPILFAIGLARPVLTSLQSSSAQGEVSLVMMLDNSLSMQASDQQELSRLDRAVEEARHLLRQQTRAELSVWSSGGGPVNVVNGSTFDLGLALRSLAKIKPGAGPSDPIAMIEAGVSQLASMTNPNKQLVIASDFQASQWNAISVDQIQRLKEMLNSGPHSIQLTLLPLAGLNSKNAEHNLSVELAPESLQGQLEPIFANEPLSITATIHNWSTRPLKNLTVSFNVDDQALASQSLDLQPNTMQQVQFGCSFKTIGKHYYSIQLQTPIETADKLSGDDRATGVIYVREPVEVVIVDPASVTVGSISTGKFLQLALSPDFIDTRFKVQLLSRMPPVDDLRSFDVLIVVGSNLDDNLANQVAEFVKLGGGLMVVPADNLDVKRINRLWFEQTPLLPGRYTERKSNTNEPQQLKQQLFQDNVLSIFNSGESGALSSVQSQQWQALELESLSAASGESSTPANVNLASNPLLLLEDNSVVMAKRLVGKGAVFQLGISPNPKWSNLSVRPSFVPLMQRLVIDLVGEGIQLPHQLHTGQVLSLSERQFRSLAGSSNSNAKTKFDSEDWSLIDPNGDKVPLAVSIGPEDKHDKRNQPLSSSGTSVTVPSLRWPGVYRLHLATDTTSKLEEAPVFVAVGVPSGESDLLLLDRSQLDQLSINLGATIVQSADDYHSVQQVRRDGKEIWRPSLVMLLVFLFAEIFLARRVTRGT